MSSLPAPLPQGFLWFSSVSLLLPKPECLMIKAKDWKDSFSAKESLHAPFPRRSLRGLAGPWTQSLLDQLPQARFYTFFWSAMGRIRQYLKLTEKLLLYWGIKSLCTQLHCPNMSPFRCDLDSNHWNFEVCGSRAHIDMVWKVTWLFLCEYLLQGGLGTHGAPWLTPHHRDPAGIWQIASMWQVGVGEGSWREAAVYGGQWGVLGSHWALGNEAAWMCRKQQL